MVLFYSNGVAILSGFHDIIKNHVPQRAAWAVSRYCWRTVISNYIGMGSAQQTGKHAQGLRKYTAV